MAEREKGNVSKEKFENKYKQKLLKEISEILTQYYLNHT